MANRLENNSSHGNDGPEPSLGARLMKAREARRIPIEGIAQQIRVPVKVVRAIEEDRVEGIAPIYLRGYVRGYARIVGLSEDSVLFGLPSVDTPVVATARSGRAMERGERSGGGLKFATLCVVAILIGLTVASFRAPVVEDVPIDAGLVEPEAPALSGSADPPEAGAPSSPAVLPSAEAPRSEPPSATTPEPAAVPSDAPAVADVSTVADAATEAEAGVSGAAAVPPSAPPDAQAPEGATVLTAGHNLVLELDRESWTEVQDAHGAKLYYALAAAGQTIKVAGEPPFRVVLGNAPDVEVYYNGKPFDITPWSRGRVARFTVGDAPPTGGQH